MTLRLSDRTVPLLSVPDVMQATDYTCGPSSLSAVLGYYQYYDWRESELAARAKTTEEFGTSPENLLSAIQQLGLTASMQ
jgi:predicted double-glycine peptidase